jgi:hypothetical protein
MSINKLSHILTTSRVSTMKRFALKLTFTAMSLGGLAVSTPAQNADLSRFTAASADGQNTGPLQLLPSDKLPGPLPRAEPGCRYLKGGQWVDFPCASEEDKAHHFGKPIVGDSIQSQPVSSNPHAAAAPFVWGSVAVTLSNPTKATEINVPKSPGAPTSNTFSIQNNTNTFPCTTCKDGYPFAAQTGKDGATVAASGTRAGDQGWVQFTYQADPTDSRVCVWNIDSTVAQATLPPGIDGVVDAGYDRTCADFPTVFPLTGNGANSQTAEVIGWVICPGSLIVPVPCILSTITYMPSNDLWVNVATIDIVGLAGQWTNVNGGIVGISNASEAAFGNTQVAQVMRVYTCVEPNTPPLGVFTPITCPANPLAPQLSGEAVNYGTTGESNNLTNGPATFSCPAGSFSCSISFTAKAP